MKEIVQNTFIATKRNVFDITEFDCHIQDKSNLSWAQQSCIYLLPHMLPITPCERIIHERWKMPQRVRMKQQILKHIFGANYFITKLHDLKRFFVSYSWLNVTNLRIRLNTMQSFSFFSIWWYFTSEALTYPKARKIRFLNMVHG